MSLWNPLATYKEFQLAAAAFGSNKDTQPLIEYISSLEGVSNIRNNRYNKRVYSPGRMIIIYNGQYGVYLQIKHQISHILGGINSIDTHPDSYELTRAEASKFFEAALGKDHSIF